MKLSNLLDKVKQRLQPVLVAKLQANRASEIKQHKVAAILHALAVGICLWIDTFIPLIMVTPFMTWFHYETAKEMKVGKQALNLVMNNDYNYVGEVVHIESALKKLNSAEIKELFSLPLTSEQLEKLHEAIKQEGFITHDDIAFIFRTEIWKQENQAYIDNGNQKLKDFLSEHDVPLSPAIVNNKSFNSKHVL